MSVRCRRGQRTFSELPLGVFHNGRYATWPDHGMVAEAQNIELDDEGSGEP